MREGSGRRRSYYHIYFACHSRTASLFPFKQFEIANAFFLVLVQLAQGGYMGWAVLLLLCVDRL